MAAADDARLKGAAEVFDVVDALVSRSRSSWGVREMAEYLRAGRSTVNRTLSLLVEVRLARRTATGQYTIGPRLLVLSRALRRSHPLFVDGSRAIAALSDETQSTAFLSIAGVPPRQCTVLMAHESATAVRYTIAPGATLPTHAGAAGLSILAIAGTDALPNEMQRYTAASMTTSVAVTAAVEEARQRGGVVSIGQHIPDAAGVAVGFSVGECLVGSISVTCPRVGFDASTADDTIDRIAQAVRVLHSNLSAASTAAVAPLALPDASSSSSLVERIGRLLSLLCTTPYARVTARQFAEIVGARAIAAGNLARSAEEGGLFVREHHDVLTPGPRLLRWAAVLDQDFRISDLIQDDLRAIGQLTGETVGFAAFDGVTARVERTVPALGAVRYVLEVGTPIPLHAGAMGKAILAYAPHLVDNIDRVILTDRTIVHREALLADLDLIRTRGWAIGDGERIPEAFGIAAPVFTDGIIAGALTITIPRYRADRGGAETFARSVMAAADRISDLLSLHRTPTAGESKQTAG